MVSRGSSHAGPTTRLAAQRLLAENQQLSAEHQQQQHFSQAKRGVQGLGAPPQGGKRREDECEDMTGTKKGRAALGDLTNVGASGASSQRTSALGKEESRAGKGLETQQTQQGPRRQAAQGLASRQRRPGAHLAQLEDDEQQGRMDTEEASKRDYVDLDASDAGDIKASAAYAEDVMDVLLQSEAKRRPNPGYLTLGGQTDITPNMRCVLVDWLVEVAQEFKLTSDTLYLAIAYIDRYLSLQPVSRSRLQLLGVSCMLIASKFEEIYAPQVQEFRYITDNSYTRAEILEMEESVLHVLSFEVAATTPRHFLRRFIKASLIDTAMPFDPRLECLAAFICELTLPDYAMLRYRPSQVAAAAVMLARLTLGNEAWSPTLRHYARQDAGSLQAPAAALHTLHTLACARGPACAVPAILDKYSSPRYKCVAQLAPPPYLPAWLFQEERPATVAAAAAAAAAAAPPPASRAAPQLPPQQHQQPGPPAQQQAGYPQRHENPVFSYAPPALPELSLSTSCEMSPGTSCEQSPAMS